MKNNSSNSLPTHSLYLSPNLYSMNT